MSKISRRQSDIIRNLANTTGYIGGVELAFRLNISVRTLRNEITTIRKLYGEDIILTLMGKGYQIGEDYNISEILNLSEEHPLKRQLIILKDILFNKDVNFYELADTHFISESTLEKDVRI
ncbi:MAG: HTH domain-containing protein [Erysipelothrix sp.]|nr:HTH domain-containing protein [Erysipelothrix sp.]